ncbi:hypothetical protein MPH_01073 [Macrophomina phaseolina MS6]|uniref:GPI anchored serine-threonine rich protein n=2 Tax=Macrophomina phaseolina TaxID=35725 RepID=K2SYD6_MACPH|nr:hypothetical protein MPH_01073 [Macrophomina phaseolina MS6]KAH7021770.1 hypothetical protein B0J12DRAFT_388306 [Macrophomina phaseolina]
MRFAVAATVLATVGFTAAQSSTSSAASSSSTSSCQAANIVEACVASIKPRTEACGGVDWDCQCTAYTDLLTCYNNCPNDPTRSSVQNQVTQFCNAANANKSTSSSSSASATASGTSTSAATASASASGTATSSNFDSFSGETSSASASSSSSTGAAVPVHIPAGGALGLAIGIAAML